MVDTNEQYNCLENFSLEFMIENSLLKCSHNDANEGIHKKLKLIIYAEMSKSEQRARHSDS